LHGVDGEGADADRLDIALRDVAVGFAERALAGIGDRLLGRIGPGGARGADDENQRSQGADRPNSHR